MKRVISMLVLLALAACHGDNKSGLPKERQQLDAEAAAKRAATATRLKAMSVPELAQLLEQQSVQGTAPFNSPPFRELTSRGPSAAATLAPLLTKDAPQSFLGLLALRELDAARYRALAPAFRVTVLVDTLRNEKYFNAFGLPGTISEPAARAIVNEGPAAVSALSALLGDTRPAPVFGSEMYMEYKAHQYRVCDYALGFLEAIRGEKVELPAEPAARDRLIAALR